VLDVTRLLGAVEWLHRKTHDGMVRKEYMLCIVKLGNHLHTPHEVAGTESNVDQDCDVQNDHYGSYKGSIHIHPPVKADPLDLHPDGREFLDSYGFSFEDFQEILKAGDHFAMVVSGPHIYALYSTTDTRPFKDIDNSEWKKYEKDYDSMFDDLSKSTLLCQEEFTRRMCSRLGYVLYVGPREKGQLKKVLVP
jgi:hypothetical protein